MRQPAYSKGGGFGIYSKHGFALTSSCQCLILVLVRGWNLTFCNSQVVVSARSSPQHQTISLLVSDEHMMRDFVLPAMWLGLQSCLDIQAGPASAYPNAALPEVELVNFVAQAAGRLRSSRKGSSGDAMMNTLREEVAPYWHVMDRVIQGVSTPTTQSVQQKSALTQCWRRLGDALQLDSRRAPRHIEDSVPVVQTFCAWPLCLYHKQKPPTILKACAGCGEVRYCSKQCQSM